MIIGRIGAANVQNKHASRDCVASTAHTHRPIMSRTRARLSKTRDEVGYRMQRMEYIIGQKCATVHDQPSGENVQERKEMIGHRREGITIIWPQYNVYNVLRI